MEHSRTDARLTRRHPSRTDNVNVPIGAVTLVAGLLTLPHPAGRETGRMPDLWGAALITAAVAALSAALVEAPTWGWTAAPTILLLLAAVATAAWFVRRSGRHPAPLLELQLLRLPRFGTAGLGTVLFGVAFAIMLLSNVLWCQDVWHWSALRTGLALVPGPALVPIVARSTARTAQRYGHGPLITVGGTLFAAAMVWRVVFVSTSPDYPRDLLPSMILGGLGVGFALGTLVAAGVPVAATGEIRDRIRVGQRAPPDLIDRRCRDTRDDHWVRPRGRPREPVPDRMVDRRRLVHVDHRDRARPDPCRARRPRQPSSPRRRMAASRP